MLNIKQNNEGFCEDNIKAGKKKHIITAHKLKYLKLIKLEKWIVFTFFNQVLNVSVSSTLYMFCFVSLCFVLFGVFFLFFLPQKLFVPDKLYNLYKCTILLVGLKSTVAEQ